MNERWLNLAFFIMSWLISVSAMGNFAKTYFISSNPIPVMFWSSSLIKSLIYAPSSRTIQCCTISEGVLGFPFNHSFMPAFAYAFNSLFNWCFRFFLLSIHPPPFPVLLQHLDIRMIILWVKVILCYTGFDTGNFLLPQRRDRGTIIQKCFWHSCCYKLL